MSVILNENSTLEEWCKELAKIYKDVSVSEYPLFRWSQFMNDVTVLAEEIRRKRYEESIPQVARILGRFLDFIGAYLNRSPIPSVVQNFVKPYRLNNRNQRRASASPMVYLA